MEEEKRRMEELVLKNSTRRTIEKTTGGKIGRGERSEQEGQNWKIVFSKPTFIMKKAVLYCEMGGGVESKERSWEVWLERPKVADLQELPRNVGN